LLPHILFEKYIKILELGIASPDNQHCANCIGTLLFPMGAEGAVQSINQFIYRDNASHDIIATG